MKFTFENVYENRKSFERACRAQDACESQYRRLLRTENREDFMDVIYDNFQWINDCIDEFEPKFEYAGDFSEGLSKIFKYDKWGFIDTNGKIVIEPKFTYVDIFINGFAVVEINEKYGFIYPDGTYLVKPNFESAYEFSEDLAAVMIDGLWGFINIDGEIVIKPEYDSTGFFENGIVYATKNGIVYAIDNFGNIIKEVVYE